MPNFDGTIDNRWRPDFESSQRRVREELAPDPPRLSRELSFVPARRTQFEPYDAQTRALIRRAAELERFPHGAEIAKLVDEWQWRDKMHSPAEKQSFLEPIIETVRRDPVRNEHHLIFLMLVFEPVRRSVGGALSRVSSGLAPAQQDINWANRAEAQLIRHAEREALYDVTREAAIEAIFGYQRDRVRALFPWLRETIAHRALDHIRGELPEPMSESLAGAEAEAVQRVLAGFDELSAPEMRDGRGFRTWRSRIALRQVFEVVDEFYRHDGVREACREAVGRLPKAQRAVIEGHFFEGRTIADLSEARATAESTIYNHKSLAQRRLKQDDTFFVSLVALGQVKDAARTRALRERYPEGRLPDGRRIVSIADQAA